MLEDEIKHNIARPELLQIAESVAREKSIDQEIVIEAMEEAIESAAKRKFKVYPSAYANMWASKQQGKGKC